LRKWARKSPDAASKIVIFFGPLKESVEGQMFGRYGNMSVIFSRGRERLELGL
jgi:hypothetical protein